MRGSVYYQTGLLAKAIFVEGAKKIDRIDPNHQHYQKIASYRTLSTYREVWNNLLNYLKEHWAVKNAEEITSAMVADYMLYKIEYYPSKQYLEKISSALGKLEIALKHYAFSQYGAARGYDFSIRQDILDTTRNLDLVADNYHNRAYKDPELLIESLKDPLHRLAARIQYEGGARIEGVSFIKPNQLHGIRHDSITRTDKGIIFTKEKGGKEGDVLIGVNTYIELEEHLIDNKTFKLDRQRYSHEIRSTCERIGLNPEGSHGLRWNFAKRRLFEYAKAGFTYEQSLQTVSWEMKHNRASITEHYLGN